MTAIDLMRSFRWFDPNLPFADPQPLTESLDILLQQTVSKVHQMINLSIQDDE